MKGKPFEIGDKCLKCNKHDESHKAKLRKPFTDPYTIVAKCGASVYYLKDYYGYKLLHSVTASHLVHFYEKGIYKCDGITSAIDPASSDVESDEPSNTPETCQSSQSKFTVENLHTKKR